MNVSRFVGSTNREALRQVRMALGSDALILSNRRVNGGVEIVAADPTWAPDVAESGEAGQDASVLSTLGEMRDALETRMEALMWGSQLSETPIMASLFQTLLSCGLSTTLVHAMLKRLPAGLTENSALLWARDQLVAHLPHVDSDNEFLTAGALIALVGPTGVGKTTTIAKLAARCVQRNGPEGLVLVTTDTWRIGAHEQLMLYGKMLGVPVHVARDDVELNHIINSLGPAQTLLVDNVGVSQRDRRISAQAALLAAASRPVQRLLVLNAASHGDTLDDVALAYSSDGGPPLQGCVVTKVDEAIRLGAVLDTAIRYKLPIRYVSVGQRVPEELTCPTATLLVDQALAPRRNAPALYVPSEADLAALLKLGKNLDARETRSQSGHTPRVLSCLLAVAGTQSGKAALTCEEVEDAGRCIAETPALAVAYDAWRHRAGEKAAADEQDGCLYSQNAVYLTHMAQQHSVLAAHLQVKLPASRQTAGQMGAVLLFSQDGQAIASPLQYLRRGEGWQSSCGAASARALSSTQTVLHQAKWLACQTEVPETIHYVSGFRQILVRSLDERDQLWISAAAPTTAVSVDDEMTTVRAVASMIDYRPVTLSDGMALDARVSDNTSAAVQPWVGEQLVWLKARGQTPLAARLLVLRFADRSHHGVSKTLYGIISPRFSSSDQAYAARCLLLGHKGGSAMRYAARMWSLLSNGGVGDLAIASQSVQLGLAAWQLSGMSDTAPIRRVAGLLAGLKTEADLPTVLLKLFALKEALQN